MLALTNTEDKDLPKWDIRIAVVGNYLPRQCGIATFTADLCNAIRTHLTRKENIFVIAMDDIPEGYDYPEIVKIEIRAEMIKDYKRAADYINISAADIVIIQHEFGIFGGEAGSYLIELLEALKKPVITTLHTILDKPAPEYSYVMKQLINNSEKLVVMSHRGRQMLHDIYNVPFDKAVYLPHGIPDIPFIDPNYYKDEFGLEGKYTILTFGLLSPGKGIENMIKAMARIVDKFPNAVYIVLGATHPHIKRRYGEQYRNELIRLAKDLNVQENVIFINKFVEFEELCKWIALADVYVTPYLNRQQIVSGTLSYAVGAGKAVVSTPYWYAEELLAEQRGILVECKDDKGLAEAVCKLLSDDVYRHRIRKNAYLFGRNMTWNKVGLEYIKLADEVVRSRSENPKPLRKSKRLYDQRPDELPEINLQHLLVLTDRVGIWQHAKYATPWRKYGYCTDDVSRGLVFTAMYWLLYEDEKILPIIHTYLSFIYDAFNAEKRRFRNFLSHDLKWLDEIGTEDTYGRTLWGLGSIIANAPNYSILALANRLFLEALPSAFDLKTLRAIAYTLLGIHYYLKRFNVDTEVRRIRKILAEKLLAAYKSNMDKDWIWCEDILTYANARVPQALIVSGQWIPDNTMIQIGLDSLKWLLEVQTGENGQLSLIGNKGWWKKGGKRARFDQQPIDAVALVQACIDAYNVTGEDLWIREARRCFEWFLGRNDLNLPMYDFITGGCRDGLGSSNVNENQGAESTLSWLISLAAMHILNKQLEQSSDVDAVMGPGDEKLNKIRK